MTFAGILLASILLLFLVSIDLFACGFSYGTAKVRVPLSRLLLITVIGRILIAAALFSAYFIRGHIPEIGIIVVATTLFCLIGFLKLATWYARRGQEQKRLSISMRETLLIAFVLSIDGIGVAFGAGLDLVTVPFILIITGVAFITDILIFKFGHYLGSVLEKRIRIDLGWVGGTVLIFIGVLNLFL